MAHSSKTAKGSYMRTNLTKLGAQALNIIERVTAEKQSHGDQNGETSAATSTFERSANVDTLAPTEEHDDNEDSGDHHETPEPVLTTQVPAPSCYSVCLLSSGWVPPTPDRGLSEKEKAAILRVFEREITAGTKVTKEIAQKRCCTTAVLTILATSMSKVKTVVNHVNSIIQIRPRSPPPDKSEQSCKILMTHPQDQVAGDRSGMRMTAKLLRKLLRSALHYQQQHKPNRFSSRTPKLYAVFHREGWTRVYTKVKNIFKKKIEQKRF